MSADGAVVVFLGGVLHAGEAEGVAAGEGGGPPEGVVADRAGQFIYLPLHLY